MSNLVRAGVVLDVLQDTYATNIVTSYAEDRGAILELNNGLDVAGVQVELNKSYN